MQHFRRQAIFGAQGRFFAIRSWAFTGLVAFLFLLAFLFLPDKGRVLLLIPIFLFGTTVARWMSKSRERLRRQTREQANFERAKRIN
jgi:uncharacterized membrane protein